MRAAVPILAVLLALSGCGRREPESAAVDDVWIRLPAIPGRPGAAYFTIRGGDEPVRLIGVRTYAADRAELHESRMEGGMMRMAMLGTIAIGAHERVTFEPGGRHAMLFGISPRITVDRQPSFVFRFSDGTTATRRAFVLSASDPPPRFVPRSGSADCRPNATRTAAEVVIVNCGR